MNLFIITIYILDKSNSVQFIMSSDRITLSASRLLVGHPIYIIVYKNIYYTIHSFKFMNS